MAASDPTVDPDMGVGAVLSTGVSLVTDDLRISALQLVGAIVSMIPILGSLLQLVVSGLAIQYADETLGNPDPESSLAVRAIMAFLTGIVLFIALFFGFLLFVIPGIFLSLKFSLAIPAVWLDDMGPIEALSESWARTSGHLGTIFLVGLVLFGLSTVLLAPTAYVFVPWESTDALLAFSQEPLAVASPPLFAIVALQAATVGALGVAANTVMYRSFADPLVDDPGADATDEFETETEF
ncbi:hypothetical protein G9C85_09080 [Halorubellus sp. JP-L1]|uniref:hypothetical protein n=1 Tax=Halorubellus sp. JP-L1 TaxID=2715753 RepID=UPI00140BC1CD|nr:hypothetical protein [Halorubellus sp. JP-L1]NHN41782.1 hypothetical protein [Halorubellus sp. JP-L1]